MSNKLIEISQLHASPPDTYVNGMVEGYLVQIRPPQGKAPAKGKLQEGAGTIDVTLWGGDASHWEGKRVRLSGKGMKVTEYKGVKQLSVGDKVMIEAAGGAQPSAPQEQMPGDPAPDQTPSAPIQARSVAQNRPSEPSVAPIHGATVGLAINNAREIWLSINQGGSGRWDEQARFEVETIAADFLAMALRLERGQEIPTAPKQDQNVPF